MPDQAADLNWQIVVLPGRDLGRPGILEWQIEGAGSYVVKSRQPRHAIAQYQQNVGNLYAGRPHSTGRADGFRRIHAVLRDAFADGRKVTVRLLENSAEADLAARKRHWTGIRGTLDALG